MDKEDKRTYLSKEKHAELINELDFLSTTRRSEIAKQLEEAKSFGDLSENAEYHQAREAQATIEGRISELEDMLEYVEIVEHHKSNSVEVGTVVTLTNIDIGEEQIFEIVGSEEVDMKLRKISSESPLGMAIVGRTKGDEFTFKAPSGKSVKYKVLKIE